MKRLLITATSLILTVNTSLALAADGIKVYNIWTTPTVPGASVAAAYMHIKSAKPVKLVKVESPLAGVTEIHLMDMQDGIMRMRAVDGVQVLPKQVVELKPGGYHVMLMMLKQPVNQGDKVPLTLTFEDAAKKQTIMRVVAKARARGSRDH